MEKKNELLTPSTGIGYYTDSSVRGLYIVSNEVLVITSCIYLAAYALAYLDIYLDFILFVMPVFLVLLFPLLFLTRALSTKHRDNFMIFEEDGIRVLRYGNTRSAYVTWDQIQHGYTWATISLKDKYLILSENPISMRKRDIMTNFFRRKIEEGLVIEIYTKKGEEVEEFIHKKLEHIRFKQKKSWYDYHYDKNMKRIDD